MDLPSLIRPGLWASVRDTYEAANYTHAVLDAVRHLTAVLRERALLDVDGVDLVSKALGGDDPKLRLTKLQTQTEKDVQVGFASVLRGIYQCVRNPRSHEKVEDDKATADRIIYFMDYLLQVIGESQQSFSIERFLALVSDPDFVPSRRYATLRVSEVPEAKRLDALIRVFRARADAPAANVALVVGALVGLLDERQKAEYVAAVSQEYGDAPLSGKNVILLFRLLTPELWPQMTEAAKMRVEHFVLRDMKSGEHYPAIGRAGPGTAATFASSYLELFFNRFGVLDCLSSKLESEAPADRAYCARYFLDDLVTLADAYAVRNRVVRALSTSVLDKGDEFVKQRLLSYAWPEGWLSALQESLASLEESDPAFLRELGEGIPF